MNASAPSLQGRLKSCGDLLARRFQVIPSHPLPIVLHFRYLHDGAKNLQRSADAPAASARCGKPDPAIGFLI
jgi:hypothetical protein